MKVYLDESGHTGRHLFDERQPLFIYAAVWLDQDLEQRIASDLQLIRAEQKSGDAELKGNRLMSTARGRGLLARCLGACVSTSTPVSVVVFNKPFQAAAVVVEDCTDHVYNNAFDARWTWDTTLKEPLAKKIHKTASPKFLMDVWRARTGTREAFIQSYERLLFSLQLSTDRSLADLAKHMAHANFGDIWDGAQSARDINWQYSPNLNAFTSVVQGIDEQAERHSLRGLQLVHDEQIEFQPALSNCFELFKNANHGSIALPNGNVFRLPLERLESLQFCPSSTTIGLQIADFVASFVRAVISQGSMERRKMFQIARWLLNAGDGVFPRLFGPVDWQERALSALVEAAG